RARRPDRGRTCPARIRSFHDVAERDPIGKPRRVIDAKPAGLDADGPQRLDHAIGTGHPDFDVARARSAISPLNRRCRPNGDDLRPQNAWITVVVECHQTETSGACYGWIMVERSRRNAVSFDARFGPRRQALTPKPRSSVAISSSPPISRHGCPALRTIGTGDGLARVSTADPENVTRMPLAGSSVSGSQHPVGSGWVGHGSAMAASLRKRPGPTGIVQICGQTTFHADGILNAQPP